MVVVEEGPGSGAQMTAVGEGLRQGPLWALWALTIPSLSLPPFGIFFII